MSNSLGDAAIVRPRLDKFYMDRIDVVRAFPERTFHYLVTLSRLAAWGLGPVPTAENLGHKETTHRRKYGFLDVGRPPFLRFYEHLLFSYCI